MEEFGPKCIYIKDVANIVADLLSRLEKSWLCLPKALTAARA